MQVRSLCCPTATSSYPSQGFPWCCRAIARCLISFLGQQRRSFAIAAGMAARWQHGKVSSCSNCSTGCFLSGTLLLALPGEVTDGNPRLGKPQLEPVAVFPPGAVCCKALLRHSVSLFSTAPCLVPGGARPHARSHP